MMVNEKDFHKSIVFTCLDAIEKNKSVQQRRLNATYVYIFLTTKNLIP